MKYEKSCGAIIYSESDNNKKLLLIKHKYSGHWSFPKGHVESGETEIETARREVMEETGIQFQLKEGFHEVVHYSPKPNIKKEVVYFLGKALSEDVRVQEEEVSAAKWAPIDEADKCVTYDNDKNLIKKARQNLLCR